MGGGWDPHPQHPSNTGLGSFGTSTGGIRIHNGGFGSHDGVFGSQNGGASPSTVTLGSHNGCLGGLDVGLGSLSELFGRRDAAFRNVIGGCGTPATLASSQRCQGCDGSSKLSRCKGMGTQATHLPAHKTTMLLEPTMAAAAFAGITGARGGRVRTCVPVFVLLVECNNAWAWIPGLKDHRFEGV